MFSVTKPSGSDMDRSKPCGDQATHFTNCMESLMLQILLIKVKRRVPHLKQDQQYAHHW